MSPHRIDYYDSPEAPKANSLVPAVNAVVVNDAGEILLIRRTDNGNPANRQPRSYFRAGQDSRLCQLDQGKAAMATWGDEEILPPGSGDESFEAVVARVHAVLLL
jgi:hypothetical protein